MRRAGGRRTARGRRTAAGGRRAAGAPGWAGGALLVGVLLALTPAAPAAAQEDGLARVEALLQAGRISDARARLADWRAAEEAGAHARLRARALLLEARLATDREAAEAAYMGVVYGYPAAPEAADALLRLGQGALTAAEATRAVGYLERLVRDYPGTAARTTGLLWLARAHRADGHATLACEAAGRAVAAADGALRPLAQAARAAACGAGTGATPVAAQAGKPPARSTDPPVRAADPPVRAGDPPVRTGDPPVRETPDGRWTAQVGAFRAVAGARTVAARLERAGFTARVVRLPESELVRVRVGRYATSAAAAATVRALGAAGFDAVVEANALAELPPTRAPARAVPCGPAGRLVCVPAQAVTFRR
ncbi:MAG: SPOR domain-containing protein [Gemmatimonadota bacterium]